VRCEVTSSVYASLTTDTLHQESIGFYPLHWWMLLYSRCGYYASADKRPVTWRYVAQGLPYRPFLESAICCHLCSNWTNRWGQMLSVWFWSYRNFELQFNSSNGSSTGT